MNQVHLWRGLVFRPKRCRRIMSGKSGNVPKLFEAPFPKACRETFWPFARISSDFFGKLLHPRLWFRVYAERLYGYLCTNHANRECIQTQLLFGQISAHRHALHKRHKRLSNWWCMCVCYQFCWFSFKRGPLCLGFYCLKYCTSERFWGALHCWSAVSRRNCQEDRAY